MSKQDKTYYVIATGGYLKKPVVEKVVITPEEQPDTKDILEDACAEHNQRFSRAIALSEAEMNQVIIHLSKLR